jgi:hypothetical protein
LPREEKEERRAERSDHLALTKTHASS